MSCPTAYVGFQHAYNRKRDTYLFEVDGRFTVLAGDKFVKYDFTESDALPESLKGTFDVIVIDPPYLTAPTNEAYANSVSQLVKRDGDRVTGKVLLITGCSIGDKAAEIYSGLDLRSTPEKGTLQRTALQVEHASGISNDFGAWANWSGADQWGA